MTMAAPETPDDRTTATGLFHYAEAYRTCAEALMRAPPPSLRFEDPMWFLAFHSLELYLKAYLRHSGMTVSAMRKVGHRLTALWDRATAAGLSCELDPRQMMQALDAGDLIRIRYIETGMIRRPKAEDLMQFLEQLRVEVFRALRAGGAIVRYEDPAQNGWPRP